MDFDKKKVLLNMVYYTAIAVMVAFVIFMFMSLSGASLAGWERTVFYILIGLLVAVVAYDVICTCMHREKFISGLMLYVVTIALIVFTLIVFAINSDNVRLFIDISERFFRLILMSYLINALAVIIYSVGQSLVKKETTFKKNK